MLVFSSAYNEYTVISKEYTGPLYFDITGVNCMSFYYLNCILTSKRIFSIFACTVYESLIGSN